MEKILLVFLSVFIWLGCNSDTAIEKENTMEELSGNWSLVSALRNGDPTESLDRAKINFINPDTLQSNLFDQDMKTPYVYDDAQLIVKGQKTYTFDVRNSGLDTLYLEGTVGNSELEMQFLRVK